MTQNDPATPFAADLPEGYQNIPEADRAKAQVFFETGASKANTGNFEYAIELCLQGLAIDPENVEAHHALRGISLKRKASGGKDLGFMEKMKLRRTAKEDRQNLINAEKLLAYDPGNTDNMLAMLNSAYKAGFYDTVMWIGAILMRANAELGAKADFKKFINLKDTYKALNQWKEAVDACNFAVRMRPDDMDLQTELKHLGAQLTMVQGRYAGGGSFRQSVRDMAGQQRLLDQDKGVLGEDAIARAVKEAEAEWQADPNEPGKIMKLVEALRRTETADNENRAIELLEEAYQRTGQFRFRKAAGEIKLAQLARLERSYIAQLRQNPADEKLKQELSQFRRDRMEQELTEYTLWAENYPTETEFRFKMATRMYALGQYDQAIPIFQQVRQDPKFRIDSTIALARSFLAAGYVDEASDTLRELIAAYPTRGDAKSIEMYYYYGRVLEQQGDVAAAQKAYSQVAQWNFNFADVQTRLRKLRGTGPGTPASTGEPM